ncbi:MAG: repressor LexA [Chloroflexi bacterium]|jgi:repressor LexA|nr:repressor LexA [Chloroflexota bacterium]
MLDLNDKQSKIISFIQDYYNEFGISPTVREIQNGCNITSTSVVDYNLKALKNKGYLDKRPDISRAIKLNNINDNFFRIPILSSIAAGEPLIVNPEQISDPESYDDYVELPNNFSKEKKLFALRVKGDSMIDALISNNDIVIMKPANEAGNGEMIAAWLPANEEVTLKRFYLRNNKVELHSENPKYDPIVVDPQNVLIKGKVVGVIRKV